MTIHCYQDAAGEWRWRLRARNGKIVADGSEGYESRRNLMRAVKTVLKAMKTCHKVVEDKPT